MNFVKLLRTPLVASFVFCRCSGEWRIDLIKMLQPLWKTTITNFYKQRLQPLSTFSWELRKVFSPTVFKKSSCLVLLKPGCSEVHLKFLKISFSKHTHRKTHIHRHTHTYIHKYKKTLTVESTFIIKLQVKYLYFFLILWNFHNSFWSHKFL